MGRWPTSSCTSPASRPASPTWSSAIPQVGSCISGPQSAGGLIGQSDPGTLSYRRSRLPAPYWPDRSSHIALAAALLCFAGLVGLVAWPWASATVPWEDLPDAKNHLVRILVVDAALR